VTNSASVLRSIAQQARGKNPTAAGTIEPNPALFPGLSPAAGSQKPSPAGGQTAPSPALGAPYSGPTDPAKVLGRGHVSVGLTGAAGDPMTPAEKQTYGVQAWPSLKDQEQGYSSLLGRLAAARRDAGSEGHAGELAKTDPMTLAYSAQMANDQIDRSIAEGRAHVDEHGDLWGDEDDGGAGSIMLDIIHENKRRTGQE
jgi:hypothetical protein